MKNQKINSDNLDNFFSFVSKAVIIIPIIIVIISLIFKFGSQKKSFPSLTIQNNSFNFDFKGPYKCYFKDDKIEAKIYIKNKNVLAEVNKEGKIKKYLLTPYVSTVENMLKSNIIGIENMASQYMKRKIDIKEILDSCKKEDFDEKIFNLK